MKETKFRIWFPEEKAFLFIQPLKHIRESVTKHHILHNQEYLQQYTGLKDKNGKQIFEGDILRFPDSAELKLIVFDDNAEIIGTVGFYLECLERCPNNGLNRRRLPCNNLNVGDHLIIGNIYEHKHLLEATE
jgi:uncharacterized phage protein (TIGR01671 family)